MIYGNSSVQGMEKKYILSADQAMMKIRRMSFEILERNKGITHLYLAGIKENGLVLAHLLKTVLEEIDHLNVQVVAVTIDKKNPLSCVLPANIDFKQTSVVVVDDVVNSGKTLLYAILPFLNCATKNIQTLTLVERSYKTFPVHVDYVGISLASTLEDHICVEVQDGRLVGAYLE